MPFTPIQMSCQFIGIAFLFHICLSVSRFAKGHVCRKIAHWFFLSQLKALTFNLLCVFHNYPAITNPRSFAMLYYVKK